VIDDDPTLHQYAKAYLSHLGVSVFSAFNSDDGLDLAHKILPNAIILDVQMPSMNGWEFLKSLKSKPLTSEILILLLTINDERYEIGANDYLFKPIDRDRLISVVANVIQTIRNCPYW
jgi:DNA-binding response OmpR family regulator